MATMQKIKTFLWFDSNAEEAVALYVSIFDGRIVEETRMGDARPGTKGKILTIAFELAGQQLVAMNGGPHFEFNEAISLAVSCESQEEVDTLWRKLTADGGAESQCGWLKDKFGLSWQIVPTALPRLLQHPDPARAARVMEAMMKMKKIDIATLEAAAR